MSGLSPGHEVFIEMPHGDMWIRGTETPVCLIAGGTGIASILGMFRRLAADRDKRPVRVFYGANLDADLVCWQELLALIEELPDAQLTGALTAAHPGWAGVEGMVTHAV